MIFTSVPADITTRIPAGRRDRSVDAGISPASTPLAQRFEQNYQPRRLDARHPRPDMGGLAWRHLARQQSAHAQLRRPLGRQPGTPRPRPTSSRTRSRSTTDRRRRGPTSPRWRRRLRLQARDPRQQERRAARGLHMERRRVERLRHPRRHRALLRDTVQNSHVQPAALQPHDHGDLRQRRQAGIRHRSDARHRHLRGGARRGPAAVAAHHHPGLPEPVHVAEQHRVPEATRRGRPASTSDLVHYNGIAIRAPSIPTCSTIRSPATTRTRRRAVRTRPGARSRISSAPARPDYTVLSTGAEPALTEQFQGGVTYTLMLAMHDDGASG